MNKPASVWYRGGYVYVRLYKDFMLICIFTEQVKIYLTAAAEQRPDRPPSAPDPRPIFLKYNTKA